MWRASICPCCTAARTAAASTSSMLCVGTRVTREGLPGAWPERPARCSSRATPLGEPICSTRSTGRKSTPRSRLDVQTTALSWPALRPCSTQSRTLWSSEPWCNAINPAQSGRASSKAWYQTSDCDRVLVNTSELALVSSSATTCGSMRRPRWPAHGKRSAWAGSKVSIVSCLGCWPCTSRPGAEPSKVCMASSRLPSVADMPHTHRPGLQPRNRASANCTCTPRLLPISSCHSSTTTILTLPSVSRASARASSSDRLSGVVTRAVGRRRDCAWRSLDEVSPVRAPSVQWRRPPSASSTSSGWRRARSVSAASARIGVIHRTVKGSATGALALRPGVGALGAGRVFIKACKAPSHTA